MTNDAGFNGGVVPPVPPALPPERETQPNGLPERIIRGPKDEDLHKFAAPVWMEEIQKNKIFNRQKRLLAEDRDQCYKPHFRLADC